MKRMSLLAVAAVACSATLVAQKTTQVHPGTAGSPHVKTEWSIDGAAISIEYGRPFLKGRDEAVMMPVGQPWRTGADQATVITSNRALKFGSVSIPAGTHTISTQPGDKEWQLLLGRLAKPGQWGIPYNPSLEVGRAPMALGKAAAPVEQVTFSIDDTPAGATLRIEWGTKSVTIPFTVG